MSLSIESERRLTPRRTLVALFAVAMFARLAVWVVFTRDWTPTSDADQYVLLARSLANGDGFSLVFPQFELHPTAFRPPLFPALLAPVAWVGGDALWPLRVATALIGSMCAPVAYLVLRRVASPWASLIGGVAVALYPPLVVNDSVVLSEGLGLLLILLTILAVSYRRPMLVGLAAGALVLARPNAYLFVAIVLAFVAVQLGKRDAALAAVAVIAVVTPWVIRNSIQLGSPRLTTSEGFNLAAVYSEQAQVNGRFTDPVFDGSFNLPEYRWAQFDERAWNAALTDAGLDGLRADPGYPATVVARNLVAFFELRPSDNLWAESVDGRNLRFRSAYLPVFYVVMAVGLVGLAARRRDPVVLLIILATAAFLIPTLLFISAPRLRAPVDLAACLGVGLFVDERIKRRRLPISTNPRTDAADASLRLAQG